MMIFLFLLMLTLNNAGAGDSGTFTFDAKGKGEPGSNDFSVERSAIEPCEDGHKQGVRQLDLQKADIRVSKVLGTGVQRFAVDGDVYTSAEVGPDYAGETWVEIPLGGDFYVETVTYNYKYYTGWSGPKNFCFKSKKAFLSCLENDELFHVEVRRGENWERCGTVRFSRGLTKTNQTYHIQCGTIGKGIRLHKAFGNINIAELQVFVPVPRVRQLDIQSFGIQFSKDLGIHHPSSALDMNLRTLAEVGPDSSGETWIEFPLGVVERVESVTYYNKYYTGWSGIKSFCFKSEKAFLSCLENEELFHVEVLVGGNWERCATVRFSRGLTRADQTYHIHCGKIGNALRLHKAFGNISIAELRVFTAVPRVRQLDLQKADIRVSKVLGTGVQRFAVDGDVYTSVEVGPDYAGETWVEVPLGGEFYVKSVTYKYKYYTAWTGPKNFCDKSEHDFLSCLENDELFHLEVGGGENWERCGTVRFSRGLTKSDQTYHIQCGKIGNALRLHKAFGNINIPELQVFVAATGWITPRRGHWYTFKDKFYIRTESSNFKVTLSLVDLSRLHSLSISFDNSLIYFELCQFYPTLKFTIAPPAVVTKIWEFTPTETSLNIKCNGVEVINFEHSDTYYIGCPKKTKNWIPEIVYFNQVPALTKFTAESLSDNKDVRQLDLQKADIQVSKVLGTGVQRFAVDGDAYTSAQVGPDSAGETWVEVPLGGVFNVQSVTYNYKYYTGWTGPKNICYKSEKAFLSCLKNDELFHVEVRRGKNWERCGTVQFSRGLTKGDQTYKIQCWTIGEELRLLKAFGNINVAELQVFVKDKCDDKPPTTKDLIDPDEADVDIVPGEDVTLKVEKLGGVITTIYWECNGERIASESTEYKIVNTNNFNTLKILDADEADAGKCVCVAEGVGTEDEAVFNLNYIENKELVITAKPTENSVTCKAKKKRCKIQFTVRAKKGDKTITVPKKSVQICKLIRGKPGACKKIAKGCKAPSFCRELKPSAKDAGNYVAVVSMSNQKVVSDPVTLTVV